jgi:hypothetical protein
MFANNRILLGVQLGVVGGKGRFDTPQKRGD